MDHERDQQLTNDLRKLLRHSEGDLDVETSTKLRLARNQVIDSLGHKRKYWYYHRSWVALPIVLALTLATVIWMQPTNQLEPMPVAGDGLPMQDYSMLSSSQDMELLENLEFYRWLDEQIEQG